MLENNPKPLKTLKLVSQDWISVSGKQEVKLLHFRLNPATLFDGASPHLAQCSLVKNKLAKLKEDTRVGNISQKNVLEEIHFGTST